MTFSACRAPLSQALIIWDFLLAYGVHLNILVIVAQLVHLKDELMKSPSPMKVLQNMPDLKAAMLISMTLDMAALLDEDVYDFVARHPFDPAVYEAIISSI